MGSLYLFLIKNKHTMLVEMFLLVYIGFFLFENDEQTEKITYKLN